MTSGKKCTKIVDLIAQQVTGASEVLSVNGKTGVVTLNKDDIGLDKIPNLAPGDWIVGCATCSTYTDYLAACPKIACNPFDGHSDICICSTQLVDGSHLVRIEDKGAANGVASLDAQGKIVTDQLPTQYSLDLQYYDKECDLPDTGDSKTLYIVKENSSLYTWDNDNSVYIHATGTLSLGETSTTAFRGDHGKLAYEHISRTDNPHNVTKEQIGLGNVVNADTTNASNITTGTLGIDLLPDEVKHVVQDGACKLDHDVTIALDVWGNKVYIPIKDLSCKNVYNADGALKTPAYTIPVDMPFLHFIEYDADTNTPNLDDPSASNYNVPSQTYAYVCKQGNFYDCTVNVGTILISKVKNPSSIDDWLIYTGGSGGSQGDIWAKYVCLCDDIQNLSSTNVHDAIDTINQQVVNLNNTAITKDKISTDNQLSQASDDLIPSQKAVKDYVDSQTAGALTFKGSYDADADNPVLEGDNKVSIVAGDMYKVSKSGDFYGITLNIGDTLIASVDDADSIGDWSIIQTSGEGNTAGGVAVTPQGNLSSQNAQDAFEELQTDIDAIVTNVGLDSSDLSYKHATTETFIRNSASIVEAVRTLDSTLHDITDGTSACQAMKFDIEKDIVLEGSVTGCTTTDFSQDVITINTSISILNPDSDLSNNTGDIPTRGAVACYVQDCLNSLGFNGFTIKCSYDAFNNDPDISCCDIYKGIAQGHVYTIACTGRGVYNAFYCAGDLLIAKTNSPDSIDDWVYVSNENLSYTLKTKLGLTASCTFDSSSNTCIKNFNTVNEAINIIDCHITQLHNESNNITTKVDTGFNVSGFTSEGLLCKELYQNSYFIKDKDNIPDMLITLDCQVYDLGQTSASTLCNNLLNGGVVPLYACKLKDKVYINNVEFDGSASITIQDNTKIPTSCIGAANGVAPLDANTKIPKAFLPDSANSAAILVYTCKAEFPDTGDTAAYYFDAQTCLSYIWKSTGDSSGEYINIASPLDSAGEGLANKAFPSNLGKVAYDHSLRLDNPHNVTKEQVGLGNVQNVDTTDASNITSGTLSEDRLPPGLGTHTRCCYNACSVWTVNHNLGKAPIMKVFDTGGNEVWANIINVDNNTTKIYFTQEFSGYVEYV